MTSRSTEIQTLIADIDNLLADNKGKRLVRVLANQGQPRQVLERVRDFLALIDTESQTTEAQPSQAALLSPLVARYIGSDDLQHNETQSQNQSFNSSQLPDQELRALIEPLRVEIETLLQERKNIVEEIRQLELSRMHNYSLASQMANQEQMIAEFLQVLANRVSTAPQLSSPVQPSTPEQMYDKLPTAPPLIKISEDTSTAVPPKEDQSSELVERISRSYNKLDQKIVELDGNINLSFETLERNLNNYRDSLSQTLVSMQQNGIQGEQLLQNWIENLMQQLQSVNIFISELASKSQSVPLNQRASLPDIDLRLVEDANVTPDLDALLLELNPDNNSPDTSNLNTSNLTQRPSQNTTKTSTSTGKQVFHPEQSQTSEVDLLYASLFGADDVIILNQVTETFSNPISVSQDLLTQEAPNSTTEEVSINTFDSLDTNLDVVLDSNSLPPDDTRQTESVISTISIESSLQSPTSIDSVNSVDINTFIEPEAVVPPIIVLNQTYQETNYAEPLEEQLIQSIDITPTSITAAPELVETEEASELINIPETPEQTTFVPDPWLDSTDAGLLDLHDFQSPHEITTTSNAWEAFVRINNLREHEEPSAVDNIALLTDLVFEDALSSSADTHNKQTPQENKFITASPKEMLLTQANALVDEAMPPNILLDEDQIQRLDQDLKNFDSEQHVNDVSSPQQRTTQPLQTPTPDPEPSISPQISVDNEVALITVDNYQDITDTVDLAWYLGIDLGTTGISAALLNRSTAEVYPLYWSTDDPYANGAKHSFRLPAEVYLPATAGLPIGSELTNADGTPIAQNLFSAELKPYLQVALPYRSEKTQLISEENKQDSAEEQYKGKTSHKWEPVLQLNEVATVPLVWMVRSLSKLLLTLKSDRNSTTLGLTATAMGISQDSFRRIIDNIAGVVCSCPSNWSEQYRFNIREALLLSKLISHPQQVFFVEEAIASLLSELDGANGEEVKLNTRNGFRRAKSNDHSLQGNTLIINIGASATEMALVELPENLLELSHNDFMLHSFAYGGKGIEIDIVCQLLLPQKWRQDSSLGLPESVSTNPLHWQPSIQGLETTRLSSLKWEELTLPRPGEPDIVERIRLLQRLESSRLGQALLDAATAMKLILQHQESFSFELADQRWVLQRRDLEGQVFVPFVRRLNRELNRLLVARGIPTEAINQAILTGGVATLGAVSRWLRQKLPNARIIQDLYLGENGAPTCSRVAYGLSLLPLHPQVLEVSRQQYTDYFLFTELLRVLPEHALSFGEVIALFEERGINTRNCQQRLLAFLEGELPAGLIPSNTESMWLTQASVENHDYKVVVSSELFEKQGSLTYRPNIGQIQHLRRFLDTVKASTQQSLEEPYTVNFAVGVPL
ncbi:hypothetical protein NIES4071_98780 [Calothrix sp. NIES-4071]|nr:hypothetical protein NIES4071_98780 [Calothrix sp. NIES-4071]BAZ64142.1 hypothetical protein NIES4105_98710 [Calothrix sp. NIES-4105]